MDFETKPIYIVIPLHNIGNVIGAYIRECEILKPTDTIYSIDLPISSDDEGNVTVKLGIIEGMVN